MWTLHRWHGIIWTNAYCKQRHQCNGWVGSEGGDALLPVIKLLLSAGNGVYGLCIFAYSFISVSILILRGFHLLHVLTMQFSCRRIITAGANINAQTMDEYYDSVGSKGDTPLLMATFRGHVEVATYLFKQKADAHKCNT